MNFSPRVSWLIAVSAALAVHGAIFVFLFESKDHVVLSAGNHVDVVWVEQQQAKAPSSPKTATQVAVAKTAAVLSTKNQANHEVRQAEHSLKQVVQPKTLETPTMLKQNEVAEIAEAKQTVAEAADMPAVQETPAQYSQQLLQHLRYPYLAQRKGWEGEVELRFAVRSQAVEALRVFSSSGYPALDDAAFQAVASASIPMTDGLYRLPVVFKLR
ncbi:MAG: hypothetical protein AUK35_01300 [Zetaproteobacteria bacterium CG2_30_46_52]|nr:MAG: hypothetical protein AUK35_01300 [Zetaproteobacteria bacterium CG2_30_46_52]